MITAIKAYKIRSFSMESLFKFLGRSRQWFAQYASRKGNISMVENTIISHVKQWRKKHPKMGSRQMYLSLTNQNIHLPVGINKFEQIVSKHGMGAGRAKKFRPLTSDGKGKGAFKNLTNGLIVNNINQLIVADITYFDIRGEWFYIFTLKDVYSQFLLSLTASNSLEEKHAVDALLECRSLRGDQALKGCIHHSDNGSQYDGNTYKLWLFNLKMRISRAGNCKQNGSAEQLNHIIKNMYLKHWAIRSLQELKEACKELQYLNNYQRVIKQNGQRTPVHFEQYIKTLSIENRHKKIMYDFNSETK